MGMPRLWLANAGLCSLCCLPKWAAQRLRCCSIAWVCASCCTPDRVVSYCSALDLRPAYVAQRNRYIGLQGNMAKLEAEQNSADTQLSQEEQPEPPAPIPTAQVARAAVRFPPADDLLYTLPVELQKVFSPCYAGVAAHSTRNTAVGPPASPKDLFHANAAGFQGRASNLPAVLYVACWP